MENPTIYVVTNGCYSDYHICGVFTDETAAEEYCNALNDPDAQVEGWTANEKRGWVLRMVYVASIWLSSGNLYNEYSHTEEGDPNLRVPDNSCEISGEGEQALVHARSFVSKGHAMKLAVEGRQAKLREALIPDSA